jgi:hypothetical protein
MLQAFMTKKNIFLIAAFLIVVGSIYFYLYRDYFRKPDIQIMHTIRAMHSRQRTRTPAGDPPESIIFSMNREYNLTYVKVVSAAEAATNKYAHPLWELKSQSNSVPTAAFAYGSHIRGLHPTVKGAQPDPLQPNVTYRLVVEAGSLKGQHDFSVQEDEAPQ